MRTYITFGQVHRHVIDDVLFDKDCVALIESDSEDEGRKIAMSLFDSKWHNSYFREDELEPEIMQYYPRGPVKVTRKMLMKNECSNFFNDDRNEILCELYQAYHMNHPYEYLDLQISLSYQNNKFINEYKLWFGDSALYVNGYDKIIKALADPDVELPNYKCKDLHIQLDEAEQKVAKLSEQLKNSCTLSPPIVTKSDEECEPF